MARWSSRFFDKEGSEMAIQTEGRLANCEAREQRLLAAQSRREGRVYGPRLEWAAGRG